MHVRRKTEHEQGTAKMILELTRNKTVVIPLQCLGVFREIICSNLVISNFLLQLECERILL